MSKKALIVGINHYQHFKNLKGAVHDAYEVETVLKRNGDGTLNFDAKLLTASGESDPITRIQLKAQIKALFNDNKDTVLFYFAGHGHIENTGGYILTSECESGDSGVSLNEVLALANGSPSRNKVIILDCCHGGIAGTALGLDDKALLAEGITILTASSKDQYSSEINGAGVFTTLLVDALNGGAANLIGQITPGSVYAHIDQSLGNWQQRPIFKTNVENFISLRTVNPPITLADLKRITELFKEKSEELQLDPTYEHTYENMIPEHSEDFNVLQRYNRVNLVIPLDAVHMYDAAMEFKSCKLTVLGQHYWNLVKHNRI